MAMKDYTPFVYAQPMRQEPTLYFGEFQAEWKGFTYKKEIEQNLYYIVPPEGRVLPYDLNGRFSKIKFLEEAINNWLETYKIEELPLTPRPLRSHTKKEMQDSNA